MYLRRGVLVLSAVAFSICGRAQVDRRAGCTNASLRGDFAYTAHGTTLATLGLPAPLTGPFVSSGSAMFDGAGHFSLTADLSFNGIVQGPITVTGTYSVNSDCSYTSQASNGATFRAVITSDGRELLILQTNTGTVITGTAIRRDHGFSLEELERARPLQCDNAGVAGSYGFLADGFAGAPTLPGAPFAPLAGVGTVTLREDGSFMMVAQRSVNGMLDPQPLPLTGKYSVFPDCSAKLTFDAGFHFDATIVSSQEMLFMETDPGTALTVRSRRL